MRSLLVVVLLLPVVACAHSTIAGTQIPDTDENREIYAVVEKMQQAFVARDAGALLDLISPSYFEDNGTAQRDDDFGYTELRAKILPESMALAKELYLELVVHDITVDDDAGRAHADVRYQSRARIEMPAGSLWDSHKEFDRIELVREDGAWRIVSGL